MFDTYEEFTAVMDRAKIGLTLRIHSVLEQVFRGGGDPDIRVRMVCPSACGIEFNIEAGPSPDRVYVSRWYFSYDESLWEQELRKLLFVFQWVRDPEVQA